MAKDLNPAFKDIKDEALSKQRDEAFAKYAEAIKNESPTPDEVKAAVELGDSVDAMDAELSARAEVAAEAATAFEAAKSRKFGTEKAEEAEPEAEEEAEEEPAEEEPEAEAEVEEETEVAEVAAKAKTANASNSKVKTVQTLARRTKRPAVPAENDTRATVSIVAAADSGFAAGATLTFDDLAKGAINRLRGMPEPNGDGNTTEDSLRRFSVAALAIPFSDDLVIDQRTSEGETLEIIDRASDEFNIKGRDGEEFESLTAANGWCAPSETLYDLASDESLDGILSLPEVQVRRGGIRYTVGPQFVDFYANAGFIQTEAQAISGTTKPCYEVSCPSFTDVRLDAVGVCIKVPILLNAAYPEMTNRFTSGTLIAHQHMVNASVIGRMVTLSGAARVFADKGSGFSDALEYASLVADQRRQSQRLAFNRTMEFVVPFWVKNVWLNDMARRTGWTSTDANEAGLNAYWSGRNVNISYVYDWQVLDETVEIYPTTYQALVYPAGTFVKGVSDVINLSAVYDAASLAGNMYTGLFMEQGLLVAKKQYGSDLVTLPICEAGRTGSANLVTCV
jgi:hypothetical protein